jgi:PilZ domain
MFKEKRRAERVKVKLPVTVTLLDKKTNTILAGPVEGQAKDFSPVGIALVLANISIDNHHLFFTCQDNSTHILQIGFTLLDAERTVVEVPARPVRYYLDMESKEKKVVLGLEFLLPPKDQSIKKLTRNLFPGEKAPASWWEKIFLL